MEMFNWNATILIRHTSTGWWQLLPVASERNIFRPQMLENAVWANFCHCRTLCEVPPCAQTHFRCSFSVIIKLQWE